MSERIGSTTKSLLPGVFCVLCLFIGFTASLNAQTAGTGALVGTVADSTGAVVPNATVTLTRTDTGQVRTSTTGADGTYKFSLLPPGTYRARFEAAGFNAVEVPSATVNVTETEVLNSSLKVGAQTQEVTVQSDVETIQTASSALGTVVAAQTVTDLPLNTRNYTNLLALSAGANASVTNASYVQKGSSLILVNGGGTAQNTFLQDGVSIGNWYSLGTGVEGALIGTFAIPNPDTIAEFKIQTGTYDAGYGRNPGANVNVITKSGTNSFHGTGFEFFRNTYLNANDWFVKHNGESKLTVDQNQFGGVIGGPVKKDKLFFFGSYQGTQQKNGASGYGYGTPTLPPIPLGNRGTCTTPSWTTLAQCDATTASFASALATAVSPNCAANASTTFDKTSQGGVQVACPSLPLAGANLVTGAAGLYNINPVAINLLQTKLANGNYLIPSSGSSGYSLATPSQPVIFKDHMYLANVDWVVNNKNTVAGRFEYEADPMNAPIAVLNATLVTQALLGSPVYTVKADDQMVLKLTTLLSSNLVNEARISYQRFVTTGNALTPFRNSQEGITDLEPGVDQLSILVITNLFTNGGYGGYANYMPENQEQFADQISWTHGKHSIRTGYEAGLVQVDSSRAGNSFGTLTFGSFPDFLIGRAGCNFTGCTATNPGNTSGATQGNVNPSGSANGASYDQMRATQMDAFVQDDYKVNSRLTLNLGVRWEYDGFLTDKHGDFTGIWPNLVNTVPNPGTGCVINGASLGNGAAGTGCSLAGFVVPSNYIGSIPSGLYRNSNKSPTQSGAPKDDFAPRIGFAWEPTSSSRWVLRGGAGYFYDQVAGQSGGDPMAASTPGKGPIVAGTQSGGTLASPWILPGVIPGIPGSYGFTPRWVVPGNLTTTGITSSNLNQIPFQQNLLVPLTYEWNLDTQYEFRPSWVLELGYVGSHGIHQTATSQSGGQGSSADVPFNYAQLAGPTCQSCSLFGVTTNTTQNVFLRVPDVGFSSTSTELSSLSAYKYNSAQVTVRKLMSHGLQMQAAYTWSRAFFAYPLGVNTFPYQVFAYGPNAYYHPQRLVVSYVWNLPLGHPEGLMGKVAEGWTLSGVTTVQDGTPLTITDPRAGTVYGASSGNAQFCSGMSASNVLSAGSLDQRVTNGLTTGGTGYFNPGVFCAPTTAASVLGPTNSGNLFGNSGLGIVLGPGQSNWDMALSKVTKVFHESQSVEFRGEFFNTFNHPQFNNPILAANSGTFGQISSASVNPRIVQLALKYSF